MNRNTDTHPDTLRLMHLLQMDHAVLSEGLDIDTGHTVTVEHLSFVYDGQPGADPLTQLRTAIDRSITNANRKAITSKTNSDQ